MDTVVDFRNDIFTQFPERFNLYFKSPIVILKIKTMLASGYEIKAMYFGDSLDPLTGCEFMFPIQTSAKMQNIFTLMNMV